MAFIPHTPDDIARMLEVIGVQSIDDLFDEIPAELRAGTLGVPPAIGEMEVGRLMTERAASDGRPLNFIGAGAYEHHIPAPVWAITTRGEFYSAYTPYQAEASQGTLQLIYEYQSMMCALTGMEVSNASLYDGASALAEACLMAVRANRASTSRRILLPRSVNPTYAQVAQSIAGNQGIVFETVDFDRTAGRTLLEIPAALQRPGCHRSGRAAAEFLRQPGRSRRTHGLGASKQDPADCGRQSHLAGAAQGAGPVGRAHRRSTKAPTSSAAKGNRWVCRLSAGGPYFGFMATRMQYVRQMPGRIVGRTVDVDGRPGFSLTLQAREQHIRRSKATSNICTNQGLMVTAATIYMSLMGAQGLAARGERQHAAYRRSGGALERRSPGVKPAFTAPRFHEAVLILDRPVGAGSRRRWRAAESSADSISPSAIRNWAMRCWYARPKPNSMPTSIRMPAPWPTS